MASRIRLTLLTTCGLTACSFVYGWAVGPLLTPAAVQTSVDAVLTRQEIRPPELPGQAAREHLPTQEWLADAPYQVMSEHGYVYYREWEPDRKKGRVRFRPFAAIWLPPEDKPDQKPVCLVCDEAVVQFEHGFLEGNSGPGRITSGAFEGDVHITGPERVRLDGRNFFFSQSAMRLWSDNAVAFQARDHSGQARAIQIELLEDDDADESATINIGGIESVRLRKDVVLNLQAPDPKDKTKQKTVPVQIKAAGSFEYLLGQNLAILEDDVRVYRPTAPGEFDSLICETLHLQFSEEKTTPVTQPVPVQLVSTGNADAQPVTEPDSPLPRGLSEKLVFERLRAEGPEVILTSQENQLWAKMTQLTYDAKAKAVTLMHPEAVHVVQEASEFFSQRVTLFQAEDDTLSEVRCEGLGRANVRDPETREQMLAMTWRNGLQSRTAERPDEQRIDIRGGVRLGQPAEGVSLGADHLTLWLKRLESKEQRNASPSGAGMRDRMKSMASKMQPDRLLAVNRVTLASEELQAATQRLEVWFEQVGSINSLGNDREPSSPPNGSRVRAKAPKDPVVLSADRIQTKVLLGTKTAAGQEKQTAQIAEVWTDGHIRVRQEHTRDGKPPLVAEATRLHILNRSKTDQRLEFRGSPARVEDRGVRMEGGVLDVDRGANKTTVTGKGMLELPVSKGLDGKPLKTPMPLNIWWNESMSFDGTRVVFFGDVKTVLDQSEMVCQHMEVELTERVDFQDPKRTSGERRPDVAKIACMDGVRVESKEFVDNRTSEIRIASFWQMTLDQATGRTQARGPGWMTIWRRGNGRRAGLTPQATVAANAGGTKKTEWEYTRIDFAGDADGNAKHRFMTFGDQVQIVYGPVSGPGVKVDPDSLPRNGGWMRCTKLTVTHHPKTKERKGYVELYADGNAELEGRNFNAKADAISYDESKELYVLKSFGTQQATIWRERKGDGPRDRADAQMMQFIPSRNRLKLERATRIGTGQ